MKKKVFSIVILLGVFFAALGQDTARYQSFFGKDSTRWNGVTEYIDFCPINHVLRTSYDTVIDSLTYKKIEYSTVILSRSHEFISEYRDPERDFFLRENREKGQLWCRFQNENESFLIADLSLTIGDTITLRNYTDHQNGRTTREIIQDTLNDNGHKVVIVKQSSWEYLAFVEGMGCTNLMEYVREHLDLWNGVICCHKDGELAYYRTYKYYDEDCVVWPWGIRSISDTKIISVSPNPCKDWTTIKGGNIRTINLYDSTGKPATKYKYIGNRLNVAELSRGFYLLHVVLENDISVTIPLIKQ